MFTGRRSLKSVFGSALFLVVCLVWILGALGAAAAADPRFAQRDKFATPHVRQSLQALRAEIANEALLDDTGLDLPPPDVLKEQAKEQNQLAAKILEMERLAKEAHERSLAAAKKPPLPETATRKSLPAVSAPAFDWTALGKVTPARDQWLYHGIENPRKCGACWAFAAMAALESSILIREGKSVDGSEQFILDAALGSSCAGGVPAEAFTVMMIEGAPKESDYPYQARKGRRTFTLSNPYRALIWGFAGKVNPVMPSVPELKAALLLHGPLAAGIRATDGFRNKYKSGMVWNEPMIATSNHLVTLVGWDDRKGPKGAWRIKNSYGPKWGENGFAWVAYGSNSIGYGTTWVEALPSFPLSEELRRWLEQAQKVAADAEKQARAAAEEMHKALDRARAEADRARAAAEKAAQEAAEKAQIAARQAENAARRQQEFVAGAGKSLDRKARQELERAAKEAKQVEERAKGEAQKAEEAAEKAARDAVEKGKDMAKAAGEKVKIKRPKLPKI